MVSIVDALLWPFKRLGDRVRSVCRWARFARNFHVRILDALGLVRSPTIVYKLRSGEVLKVRSGGPDGFRIRDIYFENPYIVPTIEELAGRAEPYVAFDIGASLGMYTVRVAALDRHKVRVYSFEPSPEHFSFLEWNVQANKFDNVTVCQAAVAGSQGKMDLYLHDALNTTHSLYYQSDKSVEVETLTLQGAMERYGLERVDHIKIDCEGAEYDIFLNASPECLRRIGAISMEHHNHPDHDASELLDLFRRSGFEVEQAGNPLHKRILRMRRKEWS